MTNLDSILRSIVKALVFPVAMYGSESWTIKKTGRHRIDAFAVGESPGLHGEQTYPS